MKPQRLTCILLITVSPFLVISTAEQWGTVCPTTCTCHESHFSELPVYRWLQDELKSEEPSHYHNNVMYDETPPSLDENVFLKMAMCIFEKYTQPDVILSNLSLDVQALIILQARDSGEITLEAEHMANFQELQVLEIHGFYHENNHSTHAESERNKVIIRNDALRPLSSLRYLNLQHVKLLGYPEQQNRASLTVVPFNEIPVNSGMHRLEFLAPAEGDGDVVPYKVYVEQQEEAALSTFTGLVNLKFIRAFNCDLREITWEMFDGLYNLKYLLLEANYLLYIPDFAFLGVPNLQTLSLAHNQLLSLQSTSLAGLFELERLDLSYNNFSHLSELSLPPFPKLERADFRHNPIESVFASTFEIMNATLSLLIGGKNSALNIQPNSFLGLSNLKTLDILNADIPRFERELLRGMPKLKELEVSGTIEGIIFDAFVEVPKLERLTLSNCSISYLSMDAFYGLQGLLYLDLSNNSLESLPPGLFDQQHLLRELLLQNNKLSTLPTGLFSEIPAKMVRLEGNPWHCTCAMKDWQPAMISKVKEKVASSNSCQFQLDKNSACSQVQSTYRYVYDKRIAPKCSFPPKFKNWNVFQVLRKELRCNSKHVKLDHNAYLKKKYKAYGMSTSHLNDQKKQVFKHFAYKHSKIIPEKKSHLNISIPNAVMPNLSEETLKMPSTEISNNTKKQKTNITSSNEQSNKAQISNVISSNVAFNTSKPQETNISLSTVLLNTSEAQKNEISPESVPLTTNGPQKSAISPITIPIQTSKSEKTGIPPSTVTLNTNESQKANMSSTTVPVNTSKSQKTDNSPSITPLNMTEPQKTDISLTTVTMNTSKPDISPISIREPQKIGISPNTVLLNTGEPQNAVISPSSVAFNANEAQRNDLNYAANVNETPIKISKKAWKLKMEKKRQEKLKQYQNNYI